jgi:hypothetical protein
VNPAAFCTETRCALESVRSPTDGTKLSLKRLGKFIGALNVVVLEPKPQRPLLASIAWQFPICSRNYCLNATPCETVMTQMDFLHVAAVPQYFPDGLGSFVVNPIAEQLQDPQLGATPAETDYCT